MSVQTQAYKKNLEQICQLQHLALLEIREIITKRNYVYIVTELASSKKFISYNVLTKIYHHELLGNQSEGMIKRYFIQFF